MAANETFPYLNSTTQPDLWSTCPAEEAFAWQQHYLTPTNFILLVIAIVLETPMCVVTTSLNVLVIVVVWRKRYLRKQKPCVLLACLAATDLLVGAVVLPVVIVGHMMRLFEAEPICIMDKMTMETVYLVCSASILHLVTISGERYIAIKHALRYETLVTTRRMTVAVAVAWAMRPAFGILVLIVSSVEHNTALEGDNTTPPHHLINTVALLYFLSFVAAVSFFQGVIFLESRRHLKHIATHQVSEVAAREILKKDKAARTTAMIVGALSVFYALQIVLYTVISIMENLPRGSVLGKMYLMDAFLYGNSLINPIIYCLWTQDFRRAFGELLNRPAARVNAQRADNPRRGRRPRRNSEAHGFPPRKRNQIAPSDPTLARDSRSHSLDLPKHLAKEHRTRRTISACGRKLRGRDRSDKAQPNT